MKSFVILLTTWLLCNSSYCQKNKVNPYLIGYTYLSKSEPVKERVYAFLGKSDLNLCTSKDKLLFVCPNVQFINLSEFREQLMPHIDSLGLNASELKDRLAYRKKHYFESYRDTTLNSLNSMKQRYCTYMAFSKVVGNVLPLVIFVNEHVGNEKPCDLLQSLKFGKALIVILAFNYSFSKIEKVFFEEVALN